MQDQAVGPAFPSENERSQPPSAEVESPVVRLDRALQRISFALDKGRQKQGGQSMERQELLANVDALILRVRDALERSAPPQPDTPPTPGEGA